MTYQKKLQPNAFYHIYNRGIDSCEIFKEAENCRYFLQLYKKNILPVADTYAYALVGWHLHLLVKIKPTNREPHLYFKDLFSTYTRAFNKRFHRHGSLFERPFRRKILDTSKYVKTVMFYIHNNPVHHHLTQRLEDYEYTSYNSYLSDKKSLLPREEVMTLFGGEKGFVREHERYSR